MPPASAPVATQTSVHTPTIAPTPAPVPAQASAPAQPSTPAPASGPGLDATAIHPASAGTRADSGRTRSPVASQQPGAAGEADDASRNSAAPRRHCGCAVPHPRPRRRPLHRPRRSTRVANLPEAAEPDTGKTRIVDFGLDVGGSTTFDGLRALWNSVRNNTADLFDDLHPMVAVRENKSRGVDLRLVVGPIASSEAATQMCATLLAARRFCQMTIFEGQPLPQASAVTEGSRAGRRQQRQPGHPAKAKPVRPPAPRP